MCCCHCCFSTPCERNSGWRAKWDTLWLGKTWQDRSSDRYLQELILWARFLYLPYLERHSSLSWWQLFMTSRELHENSRTFEKKCVFDCIYSPFTKSHMFCLFRAVSHNYLRCCLPGCNPYFAPNINLTHICYIVHRSQSHKLFIFVFLINNSKKKKKKERKKISLHI